MENKFSTKSDIDLVRKNIKLEVSQMRSELCSEMRNIRFEITADLRRLDKKLDQMGDKLVIRLSIVMVILFSIFGVLTKMI